MTTEHDWKRRADLRDEWAKFQQTTAFKEGVEVLRGFATPIVIPGETIDRMAVRQAYQSGFHACIHLLTRIHQLHTKGGSDEVLREWDWVDSKREPDLKS